MWFQGVPKEGLRGPRGHHLTKVVYQGANEITWADVSNLVPHLLTGPLKNQVV